MRVLMWFTIGFATACAIGTYLGMFWAIGVAALVFFGILSFVKYKPTKILAMILAGLSVGTFWVIGYHDLYLGAVKTYDSKTVSAAVTVSDYNYDTEYGVAVDGKIRFDGKEFSVRLYLHEKVDTCGKRIQEVCGLCRNKSLPRATPPLF